MIHTDKETLRLAREYMKIKIQGRYAFVSGELWMASSLCEAGFRVAGATYVKLRLKADDSVTDEARKHLTPRYAVRVDGETVRDAHLREPEETITVFIGSAPRDAEIRLTKLTECSQSLMALTGIQTDGAIKPLPKREKRIGFIGDSITCGYGVEAASAEEHFTTFTENAELSYAGLIADTLDMDRELFSISGSGIVSGYTGDPDVRNTVNLLPPYYEKVGRNEGTYRLPDGRQLQEIPWHFETFQPDWIVINLGTNDLSWVKDDPERKEYFLGEYVAFLQTVRRHNPSARIICTLGICGTGLNETVRNAVADYQKKTGDSLIRTLLVEEQNGERDGLGADSHPSRVTQRLLAERVMEAMKEWE